MPKLSDTMEEGTVLEWKKQDGDEVKRGDVLAEIESDKASFEIEAEADGALHIVVEKGQAVPVGEQIATIGEGAAAPAKKAPAKPKAEPKPKAEAEPQPEPEAEPEPEPPTQSPPAPRGEETSDDGQKASPLARRLARERGVDLASIQGSGPGGRIVKEDVLAAGEKVAPAEKPKPAPARRPEQDVEVEEPTRMQATIARRMSQSKSTVPHFYVTVECQVDEAVKMRQQLKETVPGAERVTMTDMLMRACALALQRY
ncbi:MAG TPA: E3 binding domain-containing protein, partial [Candidatus Dormibacteraeota bacterium]